MRDRLAQMVARGPGGPEALGPAGSEPVGYAQAVTPVMSLWIFASVAELPHLHVLIPWEGCRIACGCATGR